MLTSARDFLEYLRNNVGEATEGNWDDKNLLRALQQAYTEAFRKVAMADGQWLIKSASVTCTDSVITLPVDCSKPVYLEDENGYPVSFINSVSVRRVSRAPSSDSVNIDYKEAYVLANTIEINQSGVSGTFTLWYQQRPTELLAGTASAGGATSITLEVGLAANLNDDHYNGSYLEVRGTGRGIHLISDYVASTKVLTMATGTFDTASVYGSIPLTPPECNDFIVLKATILTLARPSSVIDEKVFQMFRADFKDAQKDMNQWLATRIIESSHVTITED